MFISLLLINILVNFYINWGQEEDVYLNNFETIF